MAEFSKTMGTYVSIGVADRPGMQPRRDTANTLIC